jgi:peptidyl-prolyl cis-trans isomerase B (cyclophilin B)
VLPYGPVPRLPLIATFLAAAVLAAGCGSSSHSSSATSTGTGSSTSATTASSTSATTGTSTSSACHTVKTPAPHGAQHLKAPTLTLDPSKTYTVTVATNCGSFAFTLDVRQQPKTAASIYALIKRGFYNGLLFQRVAAGFVIQGGDPLDTGAGGPGYTLVEAPPKGATYPLGTVAMAKTETQPDGASGSQFFIVATSNPQATSQLVGQYAILGKIVSGQSVVAAIDALPTSPPEDGMPTPAVVMQSVTVATS